MRNKRFLAVANAVLGSLVMLLAGCHTQKNAAKSDSQETVVPDHPVVEQPIIREEPILVKYGLPPVRERQRQVVEPTSATE